MKYMDLTGSRAQGSHEHHGCTHCQLAMILLSTFSGSALHWLACQQGSLIGSRHDIGKVNNRLGAICKMHHSWMAAAGQCEGGAGSQRSAGGCQKAGTAGRAGQGFHSLSGAGTSTAFCWAHLRSQAECLYASRKTIAEVDVSLLWTIRTLSRHRLLVHLAEPRDPMSCKSMKALMVILPPAGCF